MGSKEESQTLKKKNFKNGAIGSKHRQDHLFIAR
jgi:hypothetical protein